MKRKASTLLHKGCESKRGEAAATLAQRATAPVQIKNVGIRYVGLPRFFFGLSYSLSNVLSNITLFHSLGHFLLHHLPSIIQRKKAALLTYRENCLLPVNLNFMDQNCQFLRRCLRQDQLSQLDRGSLSSGSLFFFLPHSQPIFA